VPENGLVALHGSSTPNIRGALLGIGGLLDYHGFLRWREDNIAAEVVNTEESCRQKIWSSVY